MGEDEKKDKINYKEQYQLSPRLKKLEAIVIGAVKSIADKRKDNNMEPNDGILVVFGDFYPSCPIATEFEGGNSLKGTYMTVENDDFPGTLEMCITDDIDGAVIVDRTGQVLGTGAYIKVEDSSFSSSVNGTRHLAAISCTTYDEVMFTVALSKSTNKVSVYKDGERVELYDPTDTNGEDD